ncbi:pyruvate kinase [Zobellia nedashkovskayae]|uniref:pyruvate kinase n=1 Tax=Zobellia nedashkovskayae TaxID=2779510 RepID=UPI00188C04A3|nr:pyruvate kinase [Zobellia nedashkovskayae]
MNINPKKINSLIKEIDAILQKIRSEGQKAKPILRQIHPNHKKSALNLIHYHGFRQADLRETQRRLGNLGMTRFANAQGHVEDSLVKVLYLLYRLSDGVPPNFTKAKLSTKKSKKLLNSNTAALFGNPSEGRRVRIMVTMPSHAAKDYGLVRKMVQNGMNCARVNCAHDTPEVWKEIIENVKKAAEELGSPVKIAMDLAGPKIRTGAIGILPEIQKALRLYKDDILVITDDSIRGGSAVVNEHGEIVEKAHIPCQFSGIFERVNKGDLLLFDDGKIEGTIQCVAKDKFEVLITRAAEKGTKLKAEKGMNFPNTNLGISGLTSKDKEDLAFIAKHADIVNFSFVNSKKDVQELLSELQRLEVYDKLGIILKIETKFAFDNLEEILLEAMQVKKVGVMIARGDLAVETGWQDIGQVQHELLSICGAAHIPVIWATQVLENLAKNGLPSRSEITDVVTSLKSECVMLNKGPYMENVLLLLNTILSSMEDFQEKNETMLPKIRKL